MSKGLSARGDGSGKRKRRDDVSLMLGEGLDSHVPLVEYISTRPRFYHSVLAATHGLFARVR